MLEYCKKMPYQSVREHSDIDWQEIQLQVGPITMINDQNTKSFRNWCKFIVYGFIIYSQAHLRKLVLQLEQQVAEFVVWAAADARARQVLQHNRVHYACLGAQWVNASIAFIRLN